MCIRDRYWVGADESYCSQVPLDPPHTLCHFYRWIGSSSVGRACRAPCPASGCHAWHPALFLDVRRRGGSRYGGGHVSGRTQSYCTRHTLLFCATFARNLPNLSQPRPSVFLSVIFVAHRLAVKPHLSTIRFTDEL